MEEKKIILSVRNIVKIFPGTIALDYIDFDLYSGEIHGIVGRNGAGKSTLVSILYGAIQPTSGELFINNKKIVLNSTDDALKHGISLVPQEPQIFKDLTIAENLFSPRYLAVDNSTKSFFINWVKLNKICKNILDLLEINLSPDTPMSATSVGTQQLLSIGKALFINKSKIILLDEATSSVGLRDKEMIYNLINKYKKDAAIVFITHKINEIYEICDKVTVLKDGKKIETCTINETEQKKVISMMFGEKYDFNLIESISDNNISSNKDILEIKDLTSINQFENISFNLKENEILGLVGLKGAGKTELLESIAGIKQPFRGEIILSGKKVVFQSPSDALNSGIIYLPEDRAKNGLINILTVRENLLMTGIKRVTNRLGFISSSKEKKLTNNLIIKFNIKTPTSEQLVSALSGGNKQKVLVGRSFATNPKIYLLDEPTRGVDIEAKEEILKMIREDLVKNSSIMLTSPEVEDLIHICDRIVILFSGKVQKIIKKPFDLIEIHKIMYGNM